VLLAERWVDIFVDPVVNDRWVYWLLTSSKEVGCIDLAFYPFDRMLLQMFFGFSFLSNVSSMVSIVSYRNVGSELHLLTFLTP